jgi:membrane-associated two-gene conflict system component 1 (EACC1)
MSGQGLGGSFEVVVEPHNDHYDPDDDRWRDQVATLVAALDAEVGMVRRGRPVEGTKGAADQLIIALGSAGAFQAVVDCFRAWLVRDRDRRIDIRWVEGGVERSVTLTGEAVDADTIRQIAKAAVNRAGGPQWPAGTGPC